MHKVPTDRRHTVRPACRVQCSIAGSEQMTPPPQPAHSQSLSRSLSTLPEITVAGCLSSRSLFSPPQISTSKNSHLLTQPQLLTFFSVTTASSFLSNQYPKSSTMATEVSPYSATPLSPLLGERVSCPFSCSACSRRSPHNPSVEAQHERHQHHKISR